MPKVKGKGGKKNKRAKGNQEFQKRELIFKEDGQEYGQVLKMLGKMKSLKFTVVLLLVRLNHYKLQRQIIGIEKSNS